MVFLTRNPLGPGASGAGALVMEECMGQPDDMLDDEDYPAYTMGRAAEIVGCSPDFLRRLGDAKLIDPYRSGGGHRRYSRYQLRLAARAREMCDQGTDMTSACRIIILEDQLEEALRHSEVPERARGV
jgi:hypothetical protein